MRTVFFLILCLTGLFSDAQHNMPMQDNKPGTRRPFMTRMGGKLIYHLYVTDTTVNYTGKKVAAIAINGTIPAPELRFTEGDTAEIHVHNMMHMETSIHWHGLILPNSQDGVPYLTTQPIKGNSEFVYRFPIVQNGTYWYHSHSMLQEQSGMYGAFIIDKKNKSPEKDLTVLLSDWTNEKPERIERSLHNATDWYAIKKKCNPGLLAGFKRKKTFCKTQERMETNAGYGFERCVL